MKQHKIIKKQVEKLSNELTEKIKLYIKYQINDWRKIPYLFAKANGRTGWLDIAYVVFEGFYPINHDANAYIDLENGDIVYCEPKIKCPDAFIFSYATELLALDAEKIVNNLQKKISEPVHSSYSEEKVKELQNKFINEYRLEELYVRYKLEKRNEINPGIKLARELTKQRLSDFDLALKKDQERRERDSIKEPSEDEVDRAFKIASGISSSFKFSKEQREKITDGVIRNFENFDDVENQ